MSCKYCRKNALYIWFSRVGSAPTYLYTHPLATRDVIHHKITITHHISRTSPAGIYGSPNFSIT